MRERHDGAPLPGEPALRIAVSGGATCSPEDTVAAEEVGRALALAGAVLITGGKTGVMEAACRGAQGVGGITVGFLPGGEPEEANPWVTLPIPTAMGQGRSILVVRAADAVIAIAGTWGTMSEVAFARKLEVPVILLRPALTGTLGLPEADTAEQAVEMALEAGRARRGSGIKK